jgi:O-antigen/teichoic acid export membrane protein
MEKGSLARRIATGATWMVLQRWAVRAIGLVSMTLLARLLVPADFGIVALATSMAAVLDALLELGFDLALIQSQSNERKHYDSAWTLSVIRGVVTASLLLIGARPIANLYGDSRLVMVMAWLAVSSLMSGLQNIGIVEFRRELQFDREFRLLVLSKVAAFLVTVSLAWVWRVYLALIAGIVAGKAVTLAMSYTMHPYRPSLSLACGREFLHFSKWLCLDNIASAIKNRSDTFVVGKLTSPAVLGFYALAYEISNLTATELIWPISRVLFPGFAKMAHDRPRLARGFIESLSVIIFLAAPMSAGIAVTADYVVAIFLGPRWDPVVPLIQILTLYGLFNLTSANSSALYLATGRPDLIVWRNVPTLIVLFPALVLGAMKFGAEGAAWALVAAAVTGFFVNFTLLRRQLNVSIAGLFSGLWRPLLAAGLMAGTVHLAEEMWPMEDTLALIIPQLMVLVALGAATYAATVMLLWHFSGRPPGAERRAADLVNQAIGAHGLTLAQLRRLDVFRS